MSKYDFIKNGNILYWNDPDNGKASGAYKVISAPKEIDEDSIILIASDHSEAEVFPSELFPFGMTMSHKEDFQRWKARYEAEGTISTTDFPKSPTQTGIYPSVTGLSSPTTTE